MDERRWLARRDPDWRQLGVLLHKAEKRGIHALTVAELRQMLSLYRAVSGDVARAERYGPSMLPEVQGLVTRAFQQLYQGSGSPTWLGIVTFYRQEFPQMVRAMGVEIGLATALFGLGFAIAAQLAAGDPQFLEALVPPTILEQVRVQGQLWMGSIVGIEPLASSQILTNNLSVSFAAVAGGIPAGIYTIYILFYNGLVVGALSSLVAQHGLGIPFWAFVFPHGALELPAIFLAGAAGLGIGRGLVFPGRRRRAEALRAAGRQAAQILYGVVPLLVVAAVVEAFVSPQPWIPDPIKFAWGVFSVLILGQYVTKTTDRDGRGMS